MYGDLEFPDLNVIRFIDDHFFSDRVDPELFDPTSSPFWSAALAETINRSIPPQGPLDQVTTIKHTASFASPPGLTGSMPLQLQLRDTIARRPGSEVVREEAAQR